jgi:hypothetical protein
VSCLLFIYFLSRTEKRAYNKSGAQLNATGLVPRPITYNPATGTELSASQQQQLTVTLTPTDNINYTQAYATASINVTQATPTISWKNPDDIVYGTPLSSIQLDVSTSVPGDFVYTPTAGKVLSVGTHTLYFDFTPNDL